MTNIAQFWLNQAEIIQNRIWCLGGVTPQTPATLQRMRQLRHYWNLAYDEFIAARMAERRLVAA